MATPIPYIRVVTKINKRNMASVHTRCWLIYNGMFGAGAVFAGANPTLVILLALLNAFDVAQKATIGKVFTAFPARDSAASALVGAVELERAFTESLCNQSPESAPQIAAAAGMFIAQDRKQNKALLAASSAVGSSAAVLMANAGLLKGKTSKHTTFNWRGSPDGGKTWVGYASTPHAKTTVPNLAPASEWMFEVSVTVGTAAPGPWSQAVSVLIR